MYQRYADKKISMTIVKAKYAEDYLSRRRSFGVYIFSVIGGVAAGGLTASLASKIFNYQAIGIIVGTLIAIGISVLEIGKLSFRGETIKDSGFIELALKTDSGISLQKANPSWFLVDSSIFTKRVEWGSINILDIGNCRKKIFEICGVTFIKFMIFVYPQLWAPIEIRRYNTGLGFRESHNYKRDVPTDLLTISAIASELKSFSSNFEKTETILGELSGSARKTFAVPKGTRLKVDYSSDFYLKILLYSRDYNLSLTFEIPEIRSGVNKDYEDYVSRHVELRSISKKDYNRIFLSSGIEVILEASFPWFRSMIMNTTDLHKWIDNLRIRYFGYMGISE